MEIERKFLVPALPEHLDRYPVLEIEQGYLAEDPVVRIRDVYKRQVLTVPGAVPRLLHVLHDPA